MFTNNYNPDPLQSAKTLLFSLFKEYVDAYIQPTEDDIIAVRQSMLMEDVNKLKTFITDDKKKKLLICSLFTRGIDKSRDGQVLKLVDQFLTEFRDTTSGSTPVEGLAEFINLYDITIENGKLEVVANVTDEQFDLLNQLKPEEDDGNPN